jgi:hypothetical protein
LNATPPDSATSNANLLQVWPGYAKPMSRLAISQRVDLQDVERVAGQHQEFAALLRFLRLIE